MSTPKPKFVIDTNVLITTINRGNPEFSIYQAFENKSFDWTVSTDVSAEYAEQVTSFYFEFTANFVLDILCTADNVTFAEPYYRWGISAAADALITFDRHFNVFKKLSFPELTILHPSRFNTFLSKWK